MKRAKSTILALATVLFSPMAAKTDIIYDFQGIDDAASGFAVSGVLTLSDSFGSTATQLDQFISFVFYNRECPGIPLVGFILVEYRHFYVEYLYKRSN